MTRLLRAEAGAAVVVAALGFGVALWRFCGLWGDR